MKQNNRNRGALAALASVLVAGGLSANVASAGLDPIDPGFDLGFDAKMYPGAACKAYYGTQAHLFMSFQNGISPRLVTNDNGARPEALWVTCPIVRDNTANDNGTWSWAFGQGIHVWVDAPASADLEQLKCDAFSYDLISGNQLSLGQSQGRAQLEPGRYVLSLDLDRSTATGYYLMRCLLPWEATLRAYRVTEYRSTDDNR